MTDQTGQTDRGTDERSCSLTRKAPEPLLRALYWVCLPACLSAITVWPAPVEGPRKKIIAWGGIDWYSPATIQMNIRKIEELPFDGTVLQGFKANKGGEEVMFDWLCFGQERFERQQLTQTIELLRNIDFQRFTNNFLRFNVTPGDVDWFDDFGAILHNARLWAEVAKETGMKGWMFDVEDYKGQVFDYRKERYAQQKTFEEYAQQARLRGRQLMQAIQDGYPDIVILLTLGQSYCLEASQRPGGLREDGYGLLPAFLNGMIEAAGPQVRLVDGNERAYGYLTARDYFRGLHDIRRRALALVPKELRRKYRARMGASMALYVNYVFALHDAPGGLPTYYLTPEERLRLFEQNVYYALKTADEYVWCYSEGLSWWEKGYPRPTPEGALDAIRSAQAKIRQRQPLRIDMASRIASARSKMKEIMSGLWPLRRARPHRVSAGQAAPKSDGVLDDPVWNEAPRLDPFVPLKASQADQAKAATLAQVAFDNDRLYVAFRCAEPEPDRLSIIGEKKDDDIWRGDDVEVFLSTGESCLPYLHFIVNPRNLQWDGRRAKREEQDQVDWNAEWRSSARVGAQEWAVEMAIPWAAVGGRPASGTTRRANLCRQRGATNELTSWSPSFRDFLEPDHLGVWEFSE